MVGELFGAESKAQVYGNVHTFLQKNEESTSNLGVSIFEYIGLYTRIAAWCCVI